MISPQCSMLAKHLDGHLAGGKINQQNCVHSICSCDTAEFSAPRHQSDLQKVMKSNQPVLRKRTQQSCK